MTLRQGQEVHRHFEANLGAPFAGGSTEITKEPSASFRASPDGGVAPPLAEISGSGVRGAAAASGFGGDRGPHRRRVVGSGSAAAADDARSGGEHLRNHFAEVLRPGRVDEVALDTLRQARVRDDAASYGGGRQPGLDQRLQTYERPGSAVDADSIDSRRRQSRRG